MTIQLTDQPVARWVGMLAPARQLAEVLAQTEFVPRAYQGKPDAIAAAILYGDELGVDPMQALGSIHVVEGKPQPSSELMRALILRHGHHLAVHEMTATRARVSGVRADRPESERVTVEWTTDMARAAGLLNRPPWRAYPRAMLLARAFGDLGRILFPDVLKGLSYVAEDDATAADLETWGGSADVVDDQPAVAPQPPRKAIQRRPRKAAAPVADDRPPVAPPDEPAPSDPPPADGPPTSQPVGWTPDDVPLPVDVPEAARPGPIGPGMVQALNILLTSQLGSAATRDERLALLSAILDRPVESSKTMNVSEGHLVREWFGKLEQGLVAFDMDPSTGAIHVMDVEP